MSSLFAFVTERSLCRFPSSSAESLLACDGSANTRLRDMSTLLTCRCGRATEAALFNERTLGGRQYIFFASSALPEESIAPFFCIFIPDLPGILPVVFAPGRLQTVSL